MTTSNTLRSGPATRAPSAIVLRACLLVVRASSWLVPARERDRFRRQWCGELSFAVQQPAVSRLAFMRRSMLALRDAVTLRARRTRGEGPAGAPPPGGPRPRRLEELLQDLRFGQRSLRNSPGFTAVAIMTTALGIGATTTIFSLVDGILLRPLPYPEPERLVVVWPEMHFSSALIDRIAPSLESYGAFAGYSTSWEQTWLTDDGAERLRGPMATAGFFDVLGVPMTLGRGLGAGDDAPGATNIVLSERFWRERFDAGPDVIGTAMRINGREHTVVGVGGPSLAAFPPAADIVMPWILDPAAPDYQSQELKLVARLREGVGREAALSELRVFVDALKTEFELPADFGNDAEIMPLRTYLVGESRPMLLLLFGAVGLILLISSANVANLLLARALTRQREVAVRVALGAGSGRLARQILTESSLLGLLGAVPGTVFSIFGLRAVISLLPGDTPRLSSVAIDGTALAFSIAIALLTGCAVGVIPALQAARSDIRETLTSGGRTGSDSAGRQRLRRLVVLSEIALAVTLVAGAGLLVKSFLRLTDVDPGFQPAGLVTFNIDPAKETLSSASEARQYYRRLQERLDAIAGVDEAASVWKVAFSEDGGLNGLWRPDRPLEPGERSELVRWRPVTANYFSTAGLRLQRGRLFDDSDEDGEPVSVISQAAADALFAGEDPLGKQILTTMENEVPLRVVGVVEDLKLAGLDRAGPAVAYRPYNQLDEVLTTYGWYTRWMVLRTASSAAPNLASTIRNAVRSEDPTALFADYVAMPTAISNSLAARRATMTLLTVFAFSAVTLGAIGIYGVMAYAVRQRAREISIRVALGATQRRVIRDVVSDSLRVGVGGVVLGFLLTLGTARWVREFLFEVDIFDPAVLAIAAGSALLVAVTASLLPAWRAAQADPATTLGSDE